MTEKFYDVYFDPAQLEVDRGGYLMNPDALHIVELQFDEDTDTIISAKLVDEAGNVSGDASDLLDGFHVGYGDDESIREALRRFEKWLSDHLVWVESRPQTYWEPAEYIAIGIEGYVDTDDNPF